ncbi:hypothetical protein [Metabacillus dongyingensis]|uniref:hypothetical protein n=1 Tax=Metabacillus dongyingensis TaxID=2874282 RepID=UPI001CC04E10|nr:hypothetical protein [Metabacillus dongyingensis]UAL53512.1 hypothetical protein K8L98_06925 [Metabacillus dongyingensis]
MARPTILQQVTNYLQKAMETENKYQALAEKKHEEALQLEAQLKAAQDQLRFMMKDKILGTITEEEFEVIEADVSALEKKLDAKRKEVTLLDGYEVEDLVPTIQNVEALEAAYTTKQNEVITGLRFEITEAKLEYLQKLNGIGKEYEKVIVNDSLYNRLKKKIGKQPTTFPVPAFDSLYAAKGTTADITTSDVASALDGNEFAKLQTVVKQGKEDGILK